MKLSELLAGVTLREALTPELAVLEVAGLEYDSRRVGKGFVFFAFAGSRVDGRQFAQDALAKGALVIASELPRPAGFAGTWAHGYTSSTAGTRWLLLRATSIVAPTSVFCSRASPAPTARPQPPT